MNANQGGLPIKVGDDVIGGAGASDASGEEEGRNLYPGRPRQSCQSIEVPYQFYQALEKIRKHQPSTIIDQFDG